MARQCMSMKSAKITFIIAAVTLALSVTLISVFPSIYNVILKKELSLTEGSMLTKVWSDIPLPLYEKVYFFNITNPDEFLKGAAQLNVTEVGPYVYKGRWVKKHPFWNPNGTVSYRETRTYQFVRELSFGSQDKFIYTLNAPMLLASDMLKDYNVLLRMGASFGMKLVNETVIIRRTIRELVYEGYDDIIVKLAPIVKPDIPFKTGKFAWLYGKNASNDGIFTVFTGADDPSKTNIINNWNGEERLPYWKAESCNMMNGTSVEAGPPLSENPESYSFYQSLFCRTFTLNYTEDSSIRGIPTKHFEITRELLANSTENPDNYCYETKGPQPSGVLSLSSCQYDAPVWLSFPHFYMADPYYLRNVNGLQADGQIHGSSLDVEPKTGLSVGIKMRIQLNVEIKRVKGVFQLDNIQEGFYPVLWVALDVEIDQGLADYLTKVRKLPLIIVYSILGVLIGVSLILLITSLVFMYLIKRDEDDDPLIDIKEEEKLNISKRTIDPSSGSINYGSNVDRT